MSEESPSPSPPRQPLHERSNSLNNTFSSAAIRLVPSTPPRLLGQEKEDRDEVYGRTPLPTHPSHILLSPGRDRDPALAREFRIASQAQGEAGSTGSPVSTHTTHQNHQNAESATGSPISKPRSLPKKRSKKRLHIHKDNKTFSLLQDDSQLVEDTHTSPILSLSKASSFDSLASEARHAEARSNSIDSCLPLTPATPASDAKQPISADPISSSPWNYQLVGGLRKVPKTPDLKHKSSATTVDSPLPPLPPLPEVPDIPATAASHDLSAKPSFQSATTTSDTTNYKIYGDNSDSTSEVAFGPPSHNSNYELIGDPSDVDSASSVIHRPQSAVSEISNFESSVIRRPQTAASENSNYELHGDPSPTGSSVNLVPQPKYSQESLVVPPLRPRVQRSNESFGYYKSRSRESLRSGSLTSISTVLSQQEAAQAIIGSGSIITLPIFNQPPVSSLWAGKSGPHPPRSHMNESPHQWSSQLSTVLSVSEGGTERGSRSWSDDSGRMSGGFPSTPSRNSHNSRNVLSISSSLAQEEGSHSSPLSPPEPAFARGGRRQQSSSSIPIIGDQDEYGDGITDMQDLRTRPSRSRLSGMFSATSSDNGRTNTMRSTSSSRANSLLSNSIPTWAKLYYGSGERRYLGAPGSSTDGTNSRSSSFRSGSPNTDHFPLSIYSPRRRPREINPNTGRLSSRGSLEINPAPRDANNDPHGRRFRTWSLNSVWSPHLRYDRRATRHSLWDPPSVSWSTDGSWFGRRNIQIVMFTMGFIFPFGKQNPFIHSSILAN